MAGPKRRSYKPTGPTGDTGDYTRAYAQIERYEQQWFHALIKPKDLKLHEIFQWLVPTEALHRLQAAVNITSAWSPAFAWESITLPGGVVADFHVEIDTLNILCPVVSICSINHNHPIRETVLKACVELAEMRAEFDRVRAVVKWFNKGGVTPGCVMEYWPTMRVLDKDNEALRDIEPGARFKDREDIWDIMSELRPTAFTIQQCLLLPNTPDEKGPALFTVKATKTSPKVLPGTSSFRFI